MIISGTRISQNGICWLASLLVLTQLPHSLHLPLWVSLSGISLILGKALFTESFTRYFPSYALVALAIIAALAIRVQFGYFLGRDPCVAFLYLLIALKFAETRQRRDITLLVCLSGFLLFTQYFYAQTLLSALVSLPAVFAMGGSLYVLRDFSDNPGITSITRLTGKLLLQGIPLAAALFILFPRLSSPLWSLPNDASYSSGLSDSMSPGSIGELSLSGAVAFRVEFDDAVPAQKDLYWRGPVLSQFDGHTWHSGNQKKYSAITQSVNSEKPINHYTVTLEPHNSKWLFALDVPTRLPVNAAHAAESANPIAKLSNEFELIANKSVNTALRYRQSSVIRSSYNDNTPALLQNSQIAGRNHRTRQYALQLRQKYSNDEQLINAVLDHFNQQAFFYTLKPSLLGDSPIDEFLFDTRNGFCEHYASTFVYLLRAAAIPARVVTGYQGGEMNADYLIVRQSDAHAWAEAWINGRWKRYDPTAAVAPERVESGIASALGAGEPVPLMARLGNGWIKKLNLQWDSLNHGWRKYIINFSANNQLNFLKGLGISGPKPWQLLVFIMLAGSIWSIFVLKSNLLSSNKLDKTERQWKRFLLHLERSGFPRNRTQGPLDLEAHTSLEWPEQADNLHTICAIYIQLRYTLDGRDPMVRKKLLLKIKDTIQRLPSSRELKKLSMQRA